MRKMKRRITKSDLARVKQLNLISYFYNYFPDELVKNGTTDYVTRTHGSLHLSNGLWYWWKIGRGGRTALDYLIYVEEYTFIDAALYLRDLIDGKTPTMIKQKARKNVRFKEPNHDINNSIVIDYLVNKRKIDKEIVYDLISNNYIYQAANDKSVVFVGYDEFGTIKYAMKRSTNSNMKNDVFGSSKEYSFSLSNPDSNILHIFESNIDLLSYMTIQKLDNQDYKNGNYLSLSGVCGDSLALKSYLMKHGNIQHLFLHLDNDEAGNKATERIKKEYGSKYHIFDKRINIGKDVNDYLKQLLI